MAFAELIMEDKNNRVRKAPVGFSWTVLFFGPFVPLLRGDWLYFLIIAFLMIIFPFSIYYYIDLSVLDEMLTYEEVDYDAVNFLSFTFCSFLQLIFSFIYNRIYIQNLAGKGFKVKSYSPQHFVRSYPLYLLLPDKNTPTKEKIEKKTGIKL